MSNPLTRLRRRTGTGPTSPRSPRRRWARIGAITLVAALAGGAAGAGVSEIRGEPDAERPAPAAVAARMYPGTGFDLPGLLKEVLPGVVTIETTTADGRHGAGTGMIVSPDGEVLTNAHVVHQATAITVTRYGTDRAVPARLIGAAPGDDLALLRFDAEIALPAVTFGDSATLPVGSTVVAVGNALGLAAGTPTATQGIVSAAGRTITANVGGRPVTLEGLFQTDAAINPGNSGGPLFDSGGRVIGINTAVATAAGGEGSAQGVGFAIPSDQAKERLPQLRSGGTVPAPRTYLGVSTVTLTPALREAYGLVPESGAVVAQVAAGSPAATAGLRPGDVIVAGEGRPVNTSAQLASLVSASKVGSQLHLQVVRGSSTTTLTAVLAAAPLTTGGL